MLVTLLLVTDFTTQILLLASRFKVFRILSQSIITKSTDFLTIYAIPFQSRL